MLDVLERVAELVQGDATIDPAYTQPFDFEPMTLYVWEESRSYRSIGAGEVSEDFEIMAVYVTDNGGETAVATRSPDVTRLLDAWATSALEAIRLHPNDGPLAAGNMTASTDADMLRQLFVRGTALRVTGYRVLG